MMRVTFSVIMHQLAARIFKFELRAILRWINVYTLYRYGSIGDGCSIGSTFDGIRVAYTYTYTHTHTLTKLKTFVLTTFVLALFVFISFIQQIFSCRCLLHGRLISIVYIHCVFNIYHKLRGTCTITIVITRREISKI